jgi:hypothetical protein
MENLSMFFVLVVCNYWIQVNIISRKAQKLHGWVRGEKTDYVSSRERKTVPKLLTVANDI